MVTFWLPSYSCRNYGLHQGLYPQRDLAWKDFGILWRSCNLWPRIKKSRLTFSACCHHESHQEKWKDNEEGINEWPVINLSWKQFLIFKLNKVMGQICFFKAARPGLWEGANLSNWCYNLWCAGMFQVLCAGLSIPISSLDLPALLPLLLHRTYVRASNPSWH